MKRLSLIVGIVAIAALATPAPVSAEPVAVKEAPALVLPSVAIAAVSFDSIAAIVTMDSLGVSGFNARDSVATTLAPPDSAVLAVSTTRYRSHWRSVDRQRWRVTLSAGHAIHARNPKIVDRQPRLRR